MRRLLTVAACGVLLAVSGAGPASAYQVTTATGQSTARTATATPLTVTGDNASGWSRAGDTVPVTATISNPNPFHYWAHSVTAQVTGTTQCSTSNFTVMGSPVTVQQAVGANGTLVVHGISVQLAQKASGLCRSDTVTLSYRVD